MRQTITYALFDPAGNKTILAETPVSPEAQPFAAKKLMEAEPSAEQVGFVSFDKKACLRMAGGEFCGNAALSAAAFYLSRSNQKKGVVRLQVSGFDEDISVSVANIGVNKWNGTITMPSPVSIEHVRYSEEYSFPTVFFPGIAHVIIQQPIDVPSANSFASQWCRFLNVPALGLMFLNLEQNTLKPLVYVRGADTLFWESSCASGTTAVGAYLFDRNHCPVELSLKQPGGTLKITALEDGTLRLNGTVSLLRSESVLIEL